MTAVKTGVLISVLSLSAQSVAAEPPASTSPPDPPGDASNDNDAGGPANTTGEEPRSASPHDTPDAGAREATGTSPASNPNTGSQDEGTATSEEPVRAPSGPKTSVFEPGEISVRSRKPSTIDRAATQTIITRQDIEAHNDRTLSDVLRMVPGMSTYQHGKGHIRFRMRGFEMPYVALLVDGIPTVDVYEANIDTSKILIMNASQIVVNRGTCSALYGTTGTIGSINIVTQKPLQLHARAQAEVGANGDYTLNAAHGNAIQHFYYWVTGTIHRQAPFTVSKRLRPQEWVGEVMPSGLGYNVNPGSLAMTEYLGVREWPHQEMTTYSLGAKAGYDFAGGLDAGLALSYTKSEAKRYSISLANTEEYTQGAWPATDPTLSLGGSAFRWRDVYSFSVAPYVQYKGERTSVTGNVYYLYTSELLDGYQDTAETVPVAGWGGAHSNWRNTSSGFNVLPSYLVAEWNRLNGSVLFRWDKHLERAQADADFVGEGQAGGGADAAHALAGYGWFNTKRMTGDQLTVAIEDEVNLRKLIQVPIEVSAGVSYDAQRLDSYRARSQTMAQGRVTSFAAQMNDQYIAKTDSTVWGTRDSLNPVVGATYWVLDPVLLFRMSFSKKTRLPTMSQYANVYANTDVGLKPETSENLNAGVQLFFAEHAASLRADYFFSRFRQKLATVYDPTTPSIKYYTNIEGEDHQGVELIVDGKAGRVFGIVDTDVKVSYTYLRLRNRDADAQNSLIVKGKRLPDIPMHEVMVDLRFRLPTQTSLDVFGTYTANAIKYAMRANPDAGAPFSTTYYREVTMHDPLMLNVKASQKLLEGYEVYAMVRNLFDDFAADPFNPGPGRQFYVGARAEY